MSALMEYILLSPKCEISGDFSVQFTRIYRDKSVKSENLFIRNRFCGHEYRDMICLRQWTEFMCKNLVNITQGGHKPKGGSAE